MTAEQERALLQEARERLKVAMNEDSENRQMALDDLRFVAVEGAQWPDDIRADRESNDRPCITTNKIPTYIDQVIGDQRMNRPSIKVVPVDSVADPKTALILGGWTKHVQQISSSDVAIDHGFEHAVACGYGAMRVVTRYVGDSSFDQEAFIEKIDNALGVYWGRHTKYDCSDAPYCFVISDISRDEYKRIYDQDPMPFNSADSQFVEGWVTKDTVRLAEYFVKEPVRKTLYQLIDGRVVDKLTEGDEVVKQRKIDSYKIKWYLLSGNKVLDETEWVGKKYIPIIPIWGKEFNVGGKRYIRGLIRNAKDPQRMYNYWQSSDTEVVALAPKAPYLVTPKQISGHEIMWKQAHKKNYPYLLVNFDEKAPGWPKREAPPQASSAMVEKIQMADQEIRDTIGIQKAGLGMASNERSGAAIRERKMEGDVGTFAFHDNLSRSIEHLGRVLIDVAPGLLDTERIIRLGLDNGEFEFATVNQEADGKVFNDLSLGTYDVVVTVGPSFTTQRTEARQSMESFIQYFPQAAPLIGDLYAKVQDWPGAEEFSQRLEFLLPPEIKAKKAEEAAKKAGADVMPPTAAPAPPPDPLQIMQIEEGKLKLQELQIKVQQEEERLKGLQLENVLKSASSKEEVKRLVAEILQEDGQGGGEGAEGNEG